MRFWTFAAFVLFLNLSVPCPVAAQAPYPNSDVGANAALKYWQAFARLPTLGKDEEELLNKEDVVFDAATLKALDKSRASRDYLHRGARLPGCDWGLDYEDGIRLRQSFFSPARTLVHFTALHARYEFEQGNARAGWDDIIAILTLARHIKVAPIVINQMVGISIESIAIDAAAPYLPKLKGAFLQGASKALERLPVGPTIAEVILKEKQIGVEWMIREMKTVEQSQPGSWKDVWNVVVPESIAEYRSLRESVTTFEQAIKMLEEGLPWFDRLAKLTARPWKEFDALYPEFLNKAQAENPFIGLFVAQIQKLIIQGERRVMTRWALFKAAIAVVQNGPDVLKDIPDPFGSGPFEYRALDRGFELRSAALNPARPVVLMVGQRKKVGPLSPFL